MQILLVTCERQDEVLISKFLSPSNTSCRGSRKARAWGCISATGRALAPSSGGWLLGMAGNWGVEDLVNVEAHPQ